MPSIPAAALVFYTSGAVLALEILAGRLLAPYVGVTLQTYTGIIGTVLAGIALGSWWGGKAADRIDPRSLLGPLILFGGVLALLAIPFVDYLGHNLRVSRTMAVVVLAFAGFVLPAAVLSAVTPVVVKLQLASLDETGQVVGRFSALGTAGALVGTFLTGFVLIAALPTRPIIRAIGFSLIILGAATWVWIGAYAKGPSRPTAGTAAIALVAGLLSFGQANPCQHESAYFCAYVLPDPDRDSGRVLWLDTLRHSYVDLDDPTHLGFRYTRWLAATADAHTPGDTPLQVVHVGGGALTMPQWLAATRPGSTSIVLELDPLLIQIAEDELGYVPRNDDGIEVITGDARLGIRGVPDGWADLVYGDAFGGVSVPWHLTTVEFLQFVRDAMAPDGWYAMNILDYPPQDFVAAQLVTLASVFDHVALFGPPDYLRGEAGGNHLVLASATPLPIHDIVSAAAARGEDLAVIAQDGTSTVDGITWSDIIGDAQVLTDDHAPVDQLLTPWVTN
jgi:spermidine synthase